jgi:alkylhydroperoxidase family enzyme
MSYFIATTEPEHAKGQLQEAYKILGTMFQMVPKVFIAQSIRPDLLEPLVIFVNRLLIEDHALPRSTKELVAAYASKLNGCDY